MGRTLDNTLKLPLIALRKKVPLSYNILRFEINRQQSVLAIEESENNFKKNVLIAVQKNKNLNVIKSIEDIYEYAVLAKVKLKVKMSERFSIKVYCEQLVKITNVYEQNGYMMADAIVIDEFREYDHHIVETAKSMVLEKMKENKNSIEDYNGVLERVLEPHISIEEFINVIAFNLDISEELRLKYLQDIEYEKRLKHILVDLNFNEMVKNIETKINDEVNKSINESQKEYFLREKLKAIQNELGDRVKKDEEIDNLKKKILSLKMPKQTEENVLKELSRYQSMNPYSPENGSIKTFLDIIVALPWNKKTKDRNDLNQVSKILNQNHYGLEKVKDKILEYLSVQIKTKRTPQTILCLVGPPGTGKTSLAISIAEALNKKFVKHSLGGVDDEADIMGFRRTYIGAIPGWIIKGLQMAESKNCVFLLDEIDKLGKSYKGDPASALLEVLDPQQNYRFVDRFLDEPFDLSEVMFITTANTLEDIPEPLRDRMEIVMLNSYTEQEKFHIAKQHLLPYNLKINGSSQEEFEILDETIFKVIQHYTREAGVRQLSRILGQLIRKTIRKILQRNSEKVVINNKNLEEFLGHHIFNHNEIEKKDKIGVVNGLAYTQYGGDTLTIECNYYPGKGNLILTGKLGDVMKESATIALSYIKSMADKLNIDTKIFQENDFHIHVPEGAVPKDGPSAGITLATSLYSTISKRYVDCNIGMTGELTLTGLVLPIGGLKEKSIAAHRSGLKKILIPKDNLANLEEIPEEVKKELEIKPVSTVLEVFEEVLK